MLYNKTDMKNLSEYLDYALYTQKKINLIYLNHKKQCKCRIYVGIKFWNKMRYLNILLLFIIIIILYDYVY